ncbi:hypothetical protein [Guggenheimella bovis]
MTKKSSLKKRAFFLAFGLLLFLLIPTELRGTSLVKLQSILSHHDLFKKHDVSISFPSHPDFSLGMKRFDTDKLTIYYNFGKFEHFRSNFYHRESDTYNSHFGAYLLEGMRTEEEILESFRYDQTMLVLPSIGKMDGVFCVLEMERKETRGMVRIDATVETNSPLHKKKGFFTGYLQYGSPSYEGEDYPVEKSEARIYIHYLKDKDATVITYVMAKNKEIVERYSKEILERIVIK